MPAEASPPALRGTYTAPALRRGDRALCHVRDCQVRVTGWSDAPISWPRGCPTGRSPGGPSHVVDDELARAVRQESATAIMHFWGVSRYTAIKWRKALGVNRTNNEGSHSLVRAAMKKARAAQDMDRSPEYRENLRRHIHRRRLWELAPKVTHGVPWTAEHLALLGKMTDREVASRTGHPYHSVKTKRQRLRIAAYRAG